MLDTSAFLEGLLLGAGLFTSVGPKDAFVIERSISRSHLLSISLVCAGSGALLIELGARTASLAWFLMLAYGARTCRA
ncbi:MULTISPECIES: hypothetical protein [Burkholderia]|uniref:hypothetical protein n=1 Tax=Burkholderia TaxID=32008 RepID=UPI001F2BA31B|nr:MULTISPECIES: hypothetical protein [Burkholderia]